MLSFTGSLRIYVAVEPCDLRKSYEGLSAQVTTVLQRDLRSGALFVFSNRARKRATFNIPIRHRCHRIQMASSTGPTAALD
jgi:transposase